MATMYTAHLSATRTILDLPASASSISFAIRDIVESSPTRSTRISTEPNMFVVPADTSDPAEISTGVDSPVMMDLSTELSPVMTVPSAGILSPGSTLMISPSFRASADTVLTPPSSTSLELSGLILRRRRMLELAWFVVASSRKLPICMITAISAAASYSPMIMLAIIAVATRTSAVMSCSFTRPTAAPHMIGAPHIAMGMIRMNHGTRSAMGRTMQAAPNNIEANFGF